MNIISLKKLQGKEKYKEDESKWRNELKNGDRAVQQKQIYVQKEGKYISKLL